MRPASFEYVRPTSVVDACYALAEGGTALAGGQSLLPQLKFRTVRPTRVVDLNGIDELTGVSRTDTGDLVIGAMTRHQRIADNELVRSEVHVLAEAAGCIGDRQVRARGTIGGNVCHAAPTANMPIALIAAGAEAELARCSGTRRLPVEDLLLDAFAIAKDEGELLARLHVPVGVGSSGSAYLEISPQLNGVPIVNVAVVVTDAPQGVRVIIGGLLATPWRAVTVEEAIASDQLSPQVIRDAIDKVLQAHEPFTSTRGDTIYRAKAVSALIARAASLASQRAKGNN
jgi:carbon-monoxide dehydrogenase medium subunit